MAATPCHHTGHKVVQSTTVSQGIAHLSASRGVVGHGPEDAPAWAAAVAATAADPLSPTGVPAGRASAAGAPRSSASAVSCTEAASCCCSAARASRTACSPKGAAAARAAGVAAASPAGAALALAAAAGTAGDAPRGAAAGGPRAVGWAWGARPSTATSYGTIVSSGAEGCREVGSPQPSALRAGRLLLQL